MTAVLYVALIGGLAATLNPTTSHAESTPRAADPPPVDPATRVETAAGTQQASDDQDDAADVDTEASSEDHRARASDPRDPFAPAWPAIHQAVADGDVKAVRELLKTGSNVDSSVDNSWTPLHAAAIANRPGMARFLLKRDADIAARGQFDMTPLHWAALLGHHKVAHILIEHGAPLDARNLYGGTPVHDAADGAMVKLLLAAGADIEATDDRGMTALHVARSQEVAQALIDAGASVIAVWGRAADGRLPMHMQAVLRNDPPRIIVHPGEAVARIRGQLGHTSVTIRNLSPVTLRDVTITSDSRVCSVGVSPREITTLRPAQTMTLHLALRRDHETPPGEYSLPLHISSPATGVLVDLKMRLDTRSELTPSDEGLMRLGQLHVRPAPSRLHLLAYALVPLALVALWWLRRRIKKHAS